MPKNSRRAQAAALRVKKVSGYGSKAPWATPLKPFQALPEPENSQPFVVQRGEPAIPYDISLKTVFITPAVKGGAYVTDVGGITHFKKLLRPEGHQIFCYIAGIQQDGQFSYMRHTGVFNDAAQWQEIDKRQNILPNGISARAIIRGLKKWHTEAASRGESRNVQNLHPGASVITSDTEVSP